MGIRGTRRLRELSQERSDGDLLFTSVERMLDVAKKKSLYDGDSLDIEGLISLIDDLKIEYTPLDSSISGMLSRAEDTWIMKINKLHHINRQRFTIGHELAHFVLHKSESDSFTDTVFFRGVSYDNIERSANEFASRLLMPEDKIRHLINVENVRNIGELANRFKVSAAAMLYRVKQLGFKTKE